MSIMKYAFITDMQLNDCLKKLDKLIEYDVSKGIRGEIYDSDSCFWIKKKSSFDNRLQQSFYGEFCEFHGKTLIKGSFKHNTVTKFFEVFTFGFCIVAVTSILIDSIMSLILNNKGSIFDDLKGLFIAILISIFMCIFYKLAPKSSKQDDEYIIKYIMKNFNAKEYGKEEV